MDNLDNNKNLPDEEAGAEEPISPNENEEELIAFDNADLGDTDVSYAPLHLGNSEVGAEAPAELIKPARPIAKEPVEKIVSSPDRITGVKTFFTKLHAGAIDFLNKQINDWLKDNPGIVVKRTNTTTGDVIGKKTEPNLIITVWY